MCSECHQSPCHPRCPNAPDPKVICICWNCGKEIFEGDDLYNINDEHWCSECVDDCKSIAESEDVDNEP